MNARPPVFTLVSILALTASLPACDRPAQQGEPAVQPGSQPVATGDELPDEAPPPPPASSAAPQPAAPPPTPPSPGPAPIPATAPAWQVMRLGDGATATVSQGGRTLLRITCVASPPRLVVDAPGVRPIGSEERLSLGFGNDPIALVARSAGRGQGVTATGALPANIAGRILRARAIGASYGTQVLGPFAPPRGEDAMTLANACEEAASPAPPRPAPPRPGDGRREQIPVNFRGEWNTALRDCGTGRNDSRLIVEPRAVRFYESRGEVTAVRREGPRAITVEARYRGEGETWNRATRMSLSRDGEALTIDGLTRQRCPATEAGERPGRGPRR